MFFFCFLLFNFHVDQHAKNKIDCIKKIRIKTLSSIKKNKKKRFKNVTRAINENDFVNLLQFSLQKSTSKNTLKNDTI